jgi:NDP-sugar pyrophosphorylase family protein
MSGMIDPNLMILAGGIASRMKKSIEARNDLDSTFKREAAAKSKAMLGFGKGNRPFLDYLLYNASRVGYKDVLVVVSERDASMREHYGRQEKDNNFKGLRISYAVQRIPEGRIKPLGTADAVLQGMLGKVDWQEKKFTVCNSDNLYSSNALRILLESEYPNAMIDYDRRALQFEPARTTQFSITQKDHDGFLVNIIEKPGNAEIEDAKGKDGYVGVSMNIFRLDYDMVFPYLQKTPLHPIRQEKELPTAVKMMVDQHPRCLFAYPLSEHVPDLTSIDDLERVKEYLTREYLQTDW